MADFLLGILRDPAPLLLVLGMATLGGWLAAAVYDAIVWRPGWRKGDEV